MGIMRLTDFDWVLGEAFWNGVDVSSKTKRVYGRVEDGFYKFEVDLPGVKKEDLKIKVRERGLTIEGKRGSEEIQRAFFLPEGDYKEIKAELRDGVLYVRIPLKDQEVTVEVT